MSIPLPSSLAITISALPSLTVPLASTRSGPPPGHRATNSPCAKIYLAVARLITCLSLLGHVWSRCSFHRFLWTLLWKSTLSNSFDTPLQLLLLANLRSTA
ncbi:hypothetical protein DFH06DRAFT_1161106 [Mycena polygramma]|nr:hypothetical protein DFH06DRAFT_1161106 [Mycena polygramma]